jgi:hypothetical protein
MLLLLLLPPPPPLLLLLLLPLLPLLLLLLLLPLPLPPPPLPPPVGLGSAARSARALPVKVSLPVHVLTCLAACARARTAEQADARASVALNEGARRKGRTEVKKLEARISELRATMADETRLGAYLDGREQQVTAAAEAEAEGSVAADGSGAPAASEALAGVPPLDELPSKLSALSDLLENAGATDAEVEQVRISPASTPLAARLVFSGP